MTRVDALLAQYGETRTPCTYKFFDPNILVISFKEGGEHMKLQGQMVEPLKHLAGSEPIEVETVQ